MEKRVHSCYVLGSKFLRNFVLALLILIFFFIHLFQVKLLRNNEVYYFDYAGDDDIGCLLCLEVLLGIYNL